MTVMMKRNKPTKAVPISKKHLKEPEAAEKSVATTRSSRWRLLSSTADKDCITIELSATPVPLAKRSFPESATNYAGTLEAARTDDYTFKCIPSKILKVPSSYQAETPAKANSESKFIASYDIPSAQLKRFQDKKGVLSSGYVPTAFSNQQGDNRCING